MHDPYDFTDPSIPAWHLLVAAQRAGVKLRAVPMRPGRLFAWGPRSDDADAVIAAIQERADEVAPLLPQSPPPDDDEPETLVGDLPLGVLLAIVDNRVCDMLDVIRGEEAWEDAIRGRDDPPRPRTGRRVRI